MVTTYLATASRQLAEILVHHGAIHFNNHGMVGMAVIFNSWPAMTRMFQGRLTMTGMIQSLLGMIRIIQGLPG
jgi:hypothetical protein